MVPNEYAFVVEVVGPRLAIVGDEEETRANTFWAVNDGCVDIRKKDPHWGLLIKTGGAQVDQRASDIWLYDLGNGTAQVVDIVGNAEGAAPPEGGPRTPPVPSWGEKDIRSISEWIEPYPRSQGGTEGGGGGETADPHSVTVPTASAFAALEAQVAQLVADVAALQQGGGNQPGFPSKIALRTWRGRYLVAENDEQFSVAADREGAGQWETFDVEPK